MHKMKSKYHYILLAEFTVNIIFALLLQWTGSADALSAATALNPPDLKDESVQEIQRRNDLNHKYLSRLRTRASSHVDLTKLECDGAPSDWFICPSPKLNSNGLQNHFDASLKTSRRPTIRTKFNPPLEKRSKSEPPAKKSILHDKILSETRKEVNFEARMKKRLEKDLEEFRKEHLSDIIFELKTGQKVDPGKSAAFKRCMELQKKRREMEQNRIAAEWARLRAPPEADAYAAVTNGLVSPFIAATWLFFSGISRGIERCIEVSLDMFMDFIMWPKTGYQPASPDVVYYSS